MDIFTIILVILVACLLCWAVVRLPDPWRIAGIVTVAVIALIVLLSLLGLIPSALGQEPPAEVTPRTFDLSPAEESPPPLDVVPVPQPVMTPSVVEVSGVSVGIV